MKLENTVAFRYAVRGKTDPQAFYYQIKPDWCIRAAYIPQSIAEQIWMWFEFADARNKQIYLDWIADSGIQAYDEYLERHVDPVSMLMKVTQELLDQWAPERNNP